MRPTEARTCAGAMSQIHADPQARKFAQLNVRRKRKYRSLVAASNVAAYLDRISRNRF
jgi:hypothetical protein